MASIGDRAALPRAAARAAAERAAGILAAKPQVTLVYLFGSAVDSDTPNVRDVDLAVVTDPPFVTDQLMKCRADLIEATRAPIDLISLNEASIMLAWEVVDRGVCLFARDPDVETDFVTRARARYWDFKPYRDVQWRLAGERLAERRVGP